MEEARETVFIKARRRLGAFYKKYGFFKSLLGAAALILSKVRPAFAARTMSHLARRGADVARERRWVDALTPATFHAALQRRRSPIKALLLDQRIVAGLGNIYACEALYHAGIHPARAAGSVSVARLGKLTAAIDKVLDEAISAGGSSLRDFVSPDGELGYFSKTFHVYDREGKPCGCGGIVRRFVQGGRSTFYCPSCQR